MGDRSDIVVRARSGPYPVVFKAHRRRLGESLGDAATIVVISNPTVYALHGERFIKRLLPTNRRIIPVMIGDGERYKNQRTVDRVYDHLFDVGLDRQDAIIALGGGVVGDTAGYAAATFKRGVRFAQVPTSLLAMVDASVGGKVGINHKRGKNQVGAFYQPNAVLVDPRFLATLGDREMIEGMGEILKAGFLSSRHIVHRTAATTPRYNPATRDDFERLIREAIAFKARIVKRDERDHGIRAILNFGHTFGHAIEQAEGYRRYRHGEAVLAGMVAALHLSHTTGYLRANLMDSYLASLMRFRKYLPVLKRENEDYLSPIAVDKKNRDRTPVFILLERIGRPVIRAVDSRRKIVDAIVFMRRFIADGR